MEDQKEGRYLLTISSPDDPQIVLEFESRQKMLDFFAAITDVITKTKPKNEFPEERGTIQ